MLLKRTMMILILAIVLCFNAAATIYQVEDVKESLKKGIFDFLAEPDDAELNINEVKDLIDFYISIPPSATEIECSGSGSLSGEPYENIIEKTEEVSIALVCDDGTGYAECSINKPYYCYTGRLIEKCSICGCDNDLVCDGESCKDETISCFETDDGDDEDNYGMVNSSSGWAYDFCMGSTQLVEYYCSGDDILNKTYDCECQSGKCVESLDSCYDTDAGLDYLNNGTITGYYNGTSFEYSDFCIDNETLTENFCISNMPSNTEVNCTMVNASLCVNASCVT